jgi:cytochrome c peroxidase
MGVSQLGAELAPADVGKITSFLHSLTGDQPHIEYPTLPPSTVDTPRPKP